MKHLKKFEAMIKPIQYEDMTDWGSTEPQKVLKPLDPKYLNMIFADFIDQGSETDWSEKDGVVQVWEIFIKEKLEIKGSRDIDEQIENISKMSELYLDIKSCINKVKDEYPNINVDFFVWENSEDITNIRLIFNYKQ